MNDYFIAFNIANMKINNPNKFDTESPKYC